MLAILRAQHNRLNAISFIVPSARPLRAFALRNHARYFRYYRRSHVTFINVNTLPQTAREAAFALCCDANTLEFCACFSLPFFNSQTYVSLSLSLSRKVHEKTVMKNIESPMHLRVATRRYRARILMKPRLRLTIASH